MVVHNNGCLIEEERLGAIGDLAFALNQIDKLSATLVSAGDNIYLDDLVPIWERFNHKSENIIPVYREHSRAKLQRKGIAVMDGYDQVIEFQEKPADPSSQWSVAPLYFLSKPAMEKAETFIHRQEPPDAMGHLLEYLVGQVPVYAVKMAGKRLDIGDKEGYQKAGLLLNGFLGPQT